MREFTASNGLRIRRDWDGVRLYTVGESFTLPLGGDVALAEFFLAELDDRPWEGAADGDVWELVGKDGRTAQYLVECGRFHRVPLVPPSHPGWEPAGFPSDFTSGRCLWTGPEPRGSES